MGGGERDGRELVFRPNHTNEQVVVAAAVVSPEFRIAATARHPVDRFQVPQHRPVWTALKEAVRRGLSADLATLNELAHGQLDMTYLVELLTLRPDVPDAKTLAFHEEQLAWDAQRFLALTGPISNLLEAIQKGESPERVRGLSRATYECFDGWSDRSYLRSSDEVVREMVDDLRRRQQGVASYPFGLPGLDFYSPPLGINPYTLPQNERPKRRLLHGAAPGQITLVTGVPGSGKSTLTARLVLGLARQRRKVLYGAWEMTAPMTLQLLACMALNWSRADLIEGKFDDAALTRLEETARAIGRWVTFLRNPFRRQRGARTSNARHLDLIAGYIADSGCDVFVADLWKRCLAETKPEDEELALTEQQTIVQELGVHAILLQQQRLKDIESRADKRPTREGIKGSGAWIEVPDLILGVNRPALWKPIPDNVMEVFVMKQREGVAPLAIEFDWDGARGLIAGGKEVPYEMAASFSETTNPIDAKIGGRQKFGGGRG